MPQEPKRLTLPLSEEVILFLRAGDACLLNGTAYTARDAAHRRICETLDAGLKPPFELKDSAIYYAGPAPASAGHAVGPIGPTTSYRMDAYAPMLLREGARVMIGKGDRSEEVIGAIKEYRSIYFAAVGGAAALLADRVKSCETCAYPDLGAEAVYRLELQDFPVFVAIDAFGNDIYREGPAKYRL